MEEGSLARRQPNDVPPPFTPASDPATPRIASARVDVDCARTLGAIERLWTSIGYDEINWTYTPAGRRALRTVGELAERPYSVRTHYVFNSGIGW